MNTVKRKLESWIPSYARIWLVLALLMNAVTYFGTRLFTGDRYHYNMQTWLDDLIPFNSLFIYIYIGAYVQWIIGFILIARESSDCCRRYLGGEMIAKFFCMICFLIFPTTILRPEISGNGLSHRLTELIYQLDAPDNLFPSIHCLESYVCFRGALALKKVPGWYLPLTFVISVLVFASTVCLKQHVAVDMVGAVLAVEIGLLLIRWIENKRKKHG